MLLQTMDTLNVCFSHGEPETSVHDCFFNICKCETAGYFQQDMVPARLVETKQNHIFFLPKRQDNLEPCLGRQNQASQNTFVPNPIQEFVFVNLTKPHHRAVTSQTETEKSSDMSVICRKCLAVGWIHTLFPSTQQQDIELYLMLSSL